MKNRKLFVLLYILLIGLIMLSFTSCTFELTDPETECREWNESIDKRIEELQIIVPDDTCVKTKINNKEIQRLKNMKC